jgi:hypothetical protein
MIGKCSGALCAALVGCLIAAGCSADNAASTAVGEPQPDFVVGPRFPIVAASGSDLIAVDSASLADTEAPDRQVAIGVRGSDGVWRSLPAPDKSYSLAALASAGTSVVLAGGSCQDENCTRGSIEFHRLGADREQWEQIGDTVGFESGLAELTAATGPNEAAYFATPAGPFVVTDTGTPTKVPAGPSGDRSSALCLTGSTAIAVGISPTTPTEDPMDADEFVVSAMATLDMSDPESGWTDRAAPDLKGMLTGAVCGPAGPLFVQDGVETAYDLSTDRWQTQPAAVPAGVILWPTIATSAVGPGGELFVLDGTGAVWRRASDGQWAPQGITARALAATDQAVLSATASDTTLTFTPVPG